MGVGDAIGEESAKDLAFASLPNGVLVKPDSSIAPTDATIIAEAEAIAQSAPIPPMVAYATSVHGSLAAAYVFAYKRSGAGSISFTPISVGVSSTCVITNYFSGAESIVPENALFSDTVTAAGSFYIVTPIGPSGIAVIGDLGKFASMGSKRIATLIDNGATVDVTMAFAPGEAPVTLSGYAQSEPTVSASNGSAALIAYNPATGQFQVSVTAGSQNAANIALELSGSSAIRQPETEIRRLL